MRRFHEFLRACAEFVTWINAKLQMAYDESYLDPTNLRSKLQKVRKREAREGERERERGGGEEVKCSRVCVTDWARTLATKKSSIVSVVGS